jgi:hypothetical protein
LVEVARVVRARPAAFVGAFAAVPADRRVVTCVMQSE